MTVGQTANSANGNHLVDVTEVGRVFERDGNEFVALSRTNLVLNSGEFASLIGPSGCGKSTLLRLIAGLDTPTSGEVRMLGETVTGPTEHAGLMLQSATLLPWRTTRQNILLPIILHRKPTEADHQRVDELLDLVGLSEFADHYPNELSGGMQQRAALCRLLISDPELMLLDEPFGALDEFTRERLNVELASIVASQRKSALLVTHSISEAVFLSDRIFPMSINPGTVRQPIEVPFERPRSTDIMRSSAFNDLVFQVREAIGVSDD